MATPQQTRGTSDGGRRVDPRDPRDTARGHPGQAPGVAGPKDTLGHLGTPDVSFLRLAFAPRRPRENTTQWKKIKSLDGTSGLYTLIVLSVVALSLVILFRERGFFQGRKDTTFFSDPLDVTPVWNKILGSLFLLLWAIGTGLLAFLLLVPNLCTFHRGHLHKKYRWEFYSFVALLVADFLAVFLIGSARNSFKHRREIGRYESPVAHYFILVVYGIVLVQLNLLFLRIIIYNEAKDRRSPWVTLKERLDEAVLLAKADAPAMVRRKKHLNCIDFIAENVAKGLYLLAKFGRGKKRRAGGIVQTAFKKADVGISTGIVAWAGCIRWACCCHLGWTRRFDGIFGWMGPWWDGVSSHVHESKLRSLLGFLKPAVYVGDKVAWGLRNARPKLQALVQRSWDAIKEDEGYSHPAWLKGAVLTSAILTVYFGLVINALALGAINDIYFPLRRCILEYPLVTNFFLRLVNFVEGSQVASSPFLGGSPVPLDSNALAIALNQTVREYANGLLERLNGALEEDRLFNCSDGTRGDPSVLLAAINFVEADLQSQEAAAQVDHPEDVFLDETPGGVMLVFDSLMDNYRWSVWVGYGCGLLVSLYTLLSVLRQYKRISLAIRSGLFTDLQLPQEMVIVDKGLAKGNLKKVEAVVRTILTNRSWDTVIKKYPISNASFFFGILVSTAVLQLLVFGWILATILALLASLPTLIHILKPVFPVVAALSVMWLLNEVIANKIVAEKLLVQNYNVLHELYFVLFLLIYTGVYTVLGILYAVWRLVMLSVTAMVGLNRLDKNLFTIFKNKDQGHNAFWATILMHHSFLDRASDGRKMTQRNWLTLIQRVREQTGGANGGSGAENVAVDVFSPRDEVQELFDSHRPDGRTEITAQGVSKKVLDTQDDVNYLQITQSIQEWMGVTKEAQTQSKKAIPRPARTSRTLDLGHEMVPLAPQTQALPLRRQEGPSGSGNSLGSEGQWSGASSSGLERERAARARRAPAGVGALALQRRGDAMGSRPPMDDSSRVEDPARR